MGKKICEYCTYGLHRLIHGEQQQGPNKTFRYFQEMNNVIAADQ